MRVACLTFWFYDYTIQMANELARHTEVLASCFPITDREEYLESINPEVEGPHLQLLSRYAGEIGPVVLPDYPGYCHQRSMISRPGYRPLSGEVTRCLCPLIPMLRKYPLVATFP